MEEMRQCRRCRAEGDLSRCVLMPNSDASMYVLVRCRVPRAGHDVASSAACRKRGYCQKYVACFTAGLTANVQALQYSGLYTSGDTASGTSARSSETPSACCDGRRRRYGWLYGCASRSCRVDTDMLCPDAIRTYMKARPTER